MIVKSQQDIDGLKKVGSIVAMAIQKMIDRAAVGMTTKELDEIGYEVLQQHGASSAPQEMYDFPGYTCISVNQEAAHGIPGKRTLQPGDVVNVDVSAELDGYFADSGYSFQLEPKSRKIERLCEYTHQTMMNIISQLHAGIKVNQVGKMIETAAKKGRYKVVQNLNSHGIGRALHEEPHDISPVYDPFDPRVFEDGHVITIEPFLSTKADYVVEQPDGWTLKFPDKSFVAQYEHTIIITKEKPIILTEWT